MKMQWSVSFRCRSRDLVLDGIQIAKAQLKNTYKNEIRKNFYKKYRFTIKFLIIKRLFYIIYFVCFCSAPNEPATDLIRTITKTAFYLSPHS